MSGPKSLLESGMAFLRSSGMGFGETADLAVKGMALMNDVAELRQVATLVADITTEAFMAFVLVNAFRYFGPKLFYPYLSLAPFTTESKDLFLTTTPAIFVHRFNSTTYDFVTNPPYTYMNFELSKPTALIQQFEFRSPKFDSTITGKIQIDINAIVVNATVKFATSECLVKLIKLNISRIEGFKPNVFVDSNNTPNPHSQQACESFMGFIDDQFQQMFENRVYRAVHDRLRRFAYGRSLLNCSGPLVKTWLRSAPKDHLTAS